jgi:hypothetical protein
MMSAVSPEQAAQSRKNARIQGLGRNLAEARARAPINMLGTRYLSDTQRDAFVNNPDNWRIQNPIDQAHLTLALVGIGLPLADAADAVLYGGQALFALLTGDTKGAAVYSGLSMLAAGGIIPGNETGLPVRLQSSLQKLGFGPRVVGEYATKKVVDMTKGGWNMGKAVAEGGRKLKNKVLPTRVNYLGGSPAKNLARAAHSVSQHSGSEAFTLWASKVGAGQPTGAGPAGAPSRVDYLTGTAAAEASRRATAKRATSPELRGAAPPSGVLGAGAPATVPVTPAREIPGVDPLTRGETPINLDPRKPETWVDPKEAAQAGFSRGDELRSAKGTPDPRLPQAYQNVPINTKAIPAPSIDTDDLDALKAIARNEGVDIKYAYGLPEVQVNQLRNAIQRKREATQAKIYTESAGLPPEAKQVAQLSDEADEIANNLSTIGNRLQQVRAQKAALKYPSHTTPRGRKLDNEIAMLENSIATNRAKAHDIMLSEGRRTPVTPGNIPSRFEGTAVSPTTGRTMDVGEEMATRSALAARSADQATGAAHGAGIAANKNKPWADPKAKSPSSINFGKARSAPQPLIRGARVYDATMNPFGIGRESTFAALGDPNEVIGTAPAKSEGTKLPGTGDTPEDTQSSIYDDPRSSAYRGEDDTDQFIKNFQKDWKKAHKNKKNKGGGNQQTTPDVVKEVYDPSARRGDPTGEFRKDYSGLDRLRTGKEMDARIKEQRATPRSTTTPGYVPPSARGRLRANAQTDEGRAMLNERRRLDKELEYRTTPAKYGRQTAEQHAAAEKRTGRRLPRGRPVDEETGKLLEYGEYLKGLDTRNEPGLDDRPEPEPPTATDDEKKKKKDKERRERMLRRRRMGVGKF